MTMPGAASPVPTSGLTLTGTAPPVPASGPAGAALPPPPPLAPGMIYVVSAGLVPSSPPPAIFGGRRSLLRATASSGGSHPASTGGSHSYSGGGSRGYVAPMNHGTGGGGGGGVAAAPGPACISADCQRCEAGYQWLNWIATIVMFAFLAYAGYLRSQMRAQLGITGPALCCCEDNYVPWICCWPCAMCQEARTLQSFEAAGVPFDAPLAPPMQQPLLGQEYYNK